MKEGIEKELEYALSKTFNRIPEHVFRVRFFCGTYSAEYKTNAFLKKKKKTPVYEYDAIYEKFKNTESGNKCSSLLILPLYALYTKSCWQKKKNPKEIPGARYRKKALEHFYPRTLRDAQPLPLSLARVLSDTYKCYVLFRVNNCAATAAALMFPRALRGTK